MLKQRIGFEGKACWFGCQMDMLEGVKRFNTRAETHASPIPKFLLFYFVRKLWRSLSLSVTKA